MAREQVVAELQDNDHQSDGGESRPYPPPIRMAVLGENLSDLPIFACMHSASSSYQETSRRPNSSQQSEHSAAAWGGGPQGRGQGGSSVNSGGHSSSQWGVAVSGLRPEAVIDKLTERITDRLRTELKLELQVRLRCGW